MFQKCCVWCGEWSVRCPLSTWPVAFPCKLLFFILFWERGFGGVGCESKIVSSQVSDMFHGKFGDQARPETWTERMKKRQQEDAHAVQRAKSTRIISPPGLSFVAGARWARPPTTSYTSCQMVKVQFQKVPSPSPTHWRNTPQLAIPDRMYTKC